MRSWIDRMLWWVSTSYLRREWGLDESAAVGQQVEQYSH
jgi:hypothetical protein